MSSRRRPGRASLVSRLLLYYVVAYIALAGFMVFAIDRFVGEALVDDAVGDLESAARLASESLPDDESRYDLWAAEMYAASSFRTTLIDATGVVLGDSHSDPRIMEGHGDRPEVVDALAGEVGVSQRTSASTGFRQIYVALPARDDVVVRTSVPLRVVGEQTREVRTMVIGSALAVGLVGLVAVAILGRRMSRSIDELADRSLAVASGEHEVAPRRSSVSELDRLGIAISDIASALGSRLREVEEARSTLEVVLGAIPQGTVLVDADDRIVYANPSAYEIFGSVPDDLGGLAPLQLQSAVREARESRQQESRMLDHGMPARTLRAVATPFAEDSRVLLIVVDITERERADSIRRDFVANASHELKTPVSTIIASAEALHISLGRNDGSAAAFAGRIEQSARQLDLLVTDLLDLSRLERQEIDVAPVRLDLVVREEVERVRHRCEESEIGITVETEELAIEGSHRDLAVAVRNLLDNAVRYTPEGGSVAVELVEDGSDAVIRVTDSGEGIPIRDHDRVFERFYRVDSARSRDTGGTGLGLSIVKHVAETHGGVVALESELGLGSIFSIRLPLAAGSSR